MRLESVALRGVTRFTDAVSLDLRTIPSGLVAFVGNNGEGKTTFLEAPLACLYQTFASREKKLYDYVTRTDAYIEIQFTLEGQGLFKARLNLDGPHRKAEGTLSVILPDGTAAMLNDGKVSTFETEIGKRLPPIEQLLASVFAAQNRIGSFAKLDRKGKRDLFSTLLGLDHLQEMAERAQSAASLTTQELERLLARRAALVQFAESLDQLRVSIDTARQAAEASAQALADAKSAVASLEARIDGLIVQATAYTAAKGRRDNAERDLSTALNAQYAATATLKGLDGRRTSERAEAQRRHDLALNRIAAQIADKSALALESQRIDVAEAAEVKDATASIGANQKLLDNADAIRSAAAAIEKLTHDINVCRRQMGELDVERSSLFTDLERVNAALADVQFAEKDLARARTGAELLGTVPCGGEGAYASCQFLTTAEAAKRSIPSLEALIAPKAERVAERERLTNRLDAIAFARQNLAVANAGMEAEIATHKPLAGKLEQLNAVDERIKHHEDRIARATAQAEEQRQAARDRESRRITDLEAQAVDRAGDLISDFGDIEARITEQRTALDGELVQLAAAVAMLTEAKALAEREMGPNAAAADQLSTERGLLAPAREAVHAHTAALASAQSTVRGLTDRLAQAEQRAGEVASLSVTIDALRADVADWQLLAKGLGRDGLQVLEIDAAGPTVSAYCNDLLQHCDLGRFTVEIVTQVARASKGKAGETMKDDFSLQIIDSERPGESRDLSDLSGGEQVIVDEVLKSAIALQVNARNQQPIRTCWRDETTGALDPENRLRYIAMLRRVHEKGGFEHTLFVCHNPEIYVRADAQVWFKAGALDVVLPPFAEAA